MEQISIRDVAMWAVGRYEGPELPVAGVSTDSRRVTRGELFAAVRGPHHDGHDFLGEAFASGASAAMVDNPDAAAVHRGMGRPVVVVPDVRRGLADLAAAYRRRLGLRVVGITGSNGKTTTKEMLRLLLGVRAAAAPQSFNNELGVALTLLGANRNHEVCIVEMGTNAPGEIARLAEIARPDVGVVLNVGESHLEKLGSLDGVAREKFALVEALGAEGCAILNRDDPRTRAMIERAPGYVLSFGTWPDADVYACDVRTAGYSLSFRLFARKRVGMRLIGVHNVHNALAAAAVALWLGGHPYDVAERLETFRPAPMRMAVEQIGRVRLINDAYNANPGSVEAALAEMSYRSCGRRVAVLGDMNELGPSGPALHARVGRSVASSKIDVLWAIGPKSEETARAARDAGCRQVFWSASVEEAVARPPVTIRSRDVVLFKASRAMRLERVYERLREEVRSRRRSAPKASEARG